MTLYFTTPSRLPLTPPNYKMTSEHWNPGRWQMAFNEAKCHQLTVTKKINKISTSYKLHKVTSVKYIGVEITEHLHWGKHIEATTAKANKVNTFAYRNFKGCPTDVQTHCYKSLVRPVLEYTAVVCDPHQQHLKSSLEMVQRRSDRRILHDFSCTSSASALVAQLQLENLQSRRTSDRVSMMYNIINGLVVVNPAELLEPSNRSSRGHQAKLQIPHSQTDTYLHSFRLWNSVPVNASSATPLPSSRSSLKGWSDTTYNHQNR